MDHAAAPPDVGDHAPDATVLGPDGHTHRLSEAWRRGPAALVFLRHFG